MQEKYYDNCSYVNCEDWVGSASPAPYVNCEDWVESASPAPYVNCEDWV